MVEQLFLIDAVMNKEWTESFRLSSVSFDEICEDDHVSNRDTFYCVNDQRIRIEFLCESENFCCSVNVA